MDSGLTHQAYNEVKEQAIRDGCADFDRCPIHLALLDARLSELRAAAKSGKVLPRVASVSHPPIGAGKHYYEGQEVNILRQSPSGDHSTIEYPNGSIKVVRTMNIEYVDD